MLILLLILTFIVCCTGILIFYRRRQRKIEARLLEESWGKKIDRHRNFNHIRKYADFDQAPRSYTLTEQTLDDIDIESVFAFIDRAETTIGQQYLYSKIVHPSTSPEDLAAREKCSDFFVQNESVRRQAKQILHKVAKTETHLVASLFDPGLIALKNKQETIIRCLSGLAVLCTLLCWILPVIGILMLFVFGINLMIHLVFRHQNSKKLKTIRQVYQLLKNTEKLICLKTPINGESIPLAAGKLRKFRKTYHIVDLGIPVNDISGIVFYVLDIFRAFFLLEVQLLKFSFNQVIQNKSAIESYFICLGEFEMALSAASIKSDNTIIKCTPSLLPDRTSLLCQSLVHPLIEDCVANSILLRERNAFITGSNMSGKSTFLRTIIINSVLAQSLHLCFAEAFSSPILRTFSSVKIADSLEDGVSFYFEEVNIIHEMVKASDSCLGNLFVIDEIFKGTNTVERIALAKSILLYLSRPGNFVVSSSHDLELVDLIKNNFELFHFSENVLQDHLHFDHKIKPGPLQTRNAIKILDVLGFPAEIIDEAKSSAETLGEAKNVRENHSASQNNYCL